MGKGLLLLSGDEMKYGEVFALVTGLGGEEWGGGRLPGTGTAMDRTGQEEQLSGAALTRARERRPRDRHPCRRSSEVSWYFWELDFKIWPPGCGLDRAGF